MTRAKGSIERVLGEFLLEQGLAENAVDALVSTLLRDYPFVRRAGIARVRSLLCSAGLDAETAREVALALLAFEWLGRVPYERALDLLAMEASANEALGAGLVGAQLRRELSGLQSLPEPRPIGARLLRFALQWWGSR